MFSLRQAGLAATIALLFAACSSDDPQSAFRTGWLGPLIDMERIEGSGFTGVFVKRGEQPIPVETVYIDRVEIVVAAGSDLPAINPADIEAMRRMLESSLREALAERFTVADRPSPDAMLFRAALTNIGIRNSGRFSGLTSRDNLRFRFNDVLLQAELRDGSRNTRRAVSVIAPDKQTLGDRATEAWEALQPRFSVMADSLATQFEVAQAALSEAGKPAAPKEK